MRQLMSSSLSAGSRSISSIGFGGSGSLDFLGKVLLDYRKAFREIRAKFGWPD
jgi:hypothetical protein